MGCHAREKEPEGHRESLKVEKTVMGEFWGKYGLFLKHSGTAADH